MTPPPGFPAILGPGDLDEAGLVLVPERLARVIRSALDRAALDAPDMGLASLAEQLLACPGYRTDKEPWSE